MILETVWGKLDYKDQRLVDLHNMVLALFKDDNGNPLDLTPSQCEFMAPIVYKRPNRPTLIHSMCHTRFGKSMMAALAVLIRMYLFGEKWTILGPSEDQANIIMQHLLRHASDNPIFEMALKLEKGETLETLRMKRTKEHLTMKSPSGKIGEVLVLSVNASNAKDQGNKIMGFGSSNIILDEASLIPDEIEAKVFRMLADSSSDYCYVKLGNPLKRAHFFLSWIDPMYHKFDFNCDTSIKEGRLAQDFVDMARKKPNFDQLFLNLFPAEDLVDDQGWSPLLLQEDIEKAMVDEDIPSIGDRRLGVDISEGGANFNSYVVRSKNFGKLVRRDAERNLMRTAGNIVFVKRQLNIDNKLVYVDAIGVGAGVCDRMYEMEEKIHEVKVSEMAFERKLYSNLRAEAYWRLRQWIKEGGRLKRNDAWKQLLVIKYRVKDSSGAIEIMPKKDMLRLGIPSPDDADALMLTFVEPEKIGVVREMRRSIRKLHKKQNKDKGYSLRMA